MTPISSFSRALIGYRVGRGGDRVSDKREREREREREIEREIKSVAWPVSMRDMAARLSLTYTAGPCQHGKGPEGWNLVKCRE